MSSPPPKAAQGPDVTLGPQLLIVTGLFQGLALLFYLGRMYARIRPKLLLGCDDYIISIGVVRFFFC